jgi:hypothetical protein
MLARTPKTKKRRDNARKLEHKQRKAKGLACYTLKPLSEVEVEFFLERRGLLPQGIDHDRKAVAKALSAFVCYLVEQDAAR